jgi:hypothetical protein
LAIFVQDSRDPSSGTARLLFERVGSDIGQLYPQKPQVIMNSAGTILYMPIAGAGTGAENFSEYYLRGANEWEPIEAEAWVADLRKRIPAGLGIWKGIWPNPQTMRAEAGLYREGDANCCPSGGTARIQLAIRSRRLVLDSVDFELTH